MKEELVCYLLMHSTEDFSRIHGVEDVKGFEKWIWEQVASFAGTPESWLEDKVQQYKEAA